VIRAVTFDAAGTLIAPAEPVGTTYARIARRFGIVAESAPVEAAFRRAFHAAPPLAFPNVVAADVAGCERGWWRRIVRAALEPLPTTADFEACFDAIYSHFAHAAAWHVFADVAPALATLRARGLRLGVVSNFDGRLPGLLAELDLASRVDAIVWSTRVGAAKPAAAIFVAAARALAVDVAELLHVGDDLACDVEGARAAGAHAVQVARGTATTDAIADLRALADRIGTQA